MNMDELPVIYGASENEFDHAVASKTNHEFSKRCIIPNALVKILYG